MHVRIADQHRKHDPSYEVIDRVDTGFGRQHRGNVGIGALLVLVTGVNAEDLREVLHVHALRRGAIEAFDGKSLMAPCFDTRGQVMKRIDWDELDRRDLDADRARQFEHGKLVLGHGGKASRGELHDPPATPCHPPGWSARPWLPQSQRT